MNDTNFLVEVKDCPKCNHLMFWWEEKGEREWRCDNCKHTEPYSKQTSGEITDMVISFSVKEAREQLLNEGVVHTFRWRRRAFFTKQKGDVEHTWANEGRTKPKLCDVDIHEIGEFDPGEVDKETRIPNHPLWKYTELSGFDSLLEWESAISDKAPPFGVTEGWLYKVTLRKCSDTPTEVN